ncbi:MAG: ATP-binding protein, partial [Solirubrobacteraceae bacterium]
MKRVPIRIRLALAFAALMSLVLVGTGVFVYRSLGTELDARLRDDLRARAAEIATLPEHEDSGLPNVRPAAGARAGHPSASFSQILDPSGTVLASSLPVGAAAILTGVQVRRATARPLIVDRTLPGFQEPVRIFAQSASPYDRRVVVVAGMSLLDRDRTLSRLLLLLVIGEGAALAVAAIAAYALAGASLRPVELMRRRAVGITAADVAQRLPVPPARDEIAQLAQSLNGMLDRLEHALLREREFVADASHELRTPLGLVKSQLELALYEEGSYEELRAALASALEENEHAVALTEDLLVLARLDHGQVRLVEEPVVIRELFAELRSRLGPRASESGRIIAAESTDGLTVCADRARITQALGNLIENALRHGAGDICLLADQADGTTNLHVRDHGKGFPNAFTERAFERFAQADSARSANSTGLGLAIVKAIATAHGGTAHARNAPSGGAHVWLELPTRGPAKPPQDPPISTNPGSARAPAASNGAADESLSTA